MEESENGNNRPFPIPLTVQATPDYFTERRLRRTSRSNALNSTSSSFSSPTPGRCGSIDVAAENRARREAARVEQDRLDALAAGSSGASTPNRPRAHSGVSGRPPAASMPSRFSRPSSSSGIPAPPWSASNSRAPSASGQQRRGSGYPGVSPAPRRGSGASSRRPSTSSGRVDDSGLSASSRAAPRTSRSNSTTPSTSSGQDPLDSLYFQPTMYSEQMGLPPAFPPLADDTGPAGYDPPRRDVSPRSSQSGNGSGGSPEIPRSDPSSSDVRSSSSENDSLWFSTRQRPLSIANPDPPSSDVKSSSSENDSLGVPSSLQGSLSIASDASLG
jgi:hypothetical protein